MSYPRFIIWPDLPKIKHHMQVNLNFVTLTKFELDTRKLYHDLLAFPLRYKTTAFITAHVWQICMIGSLVNIVVKPSIPLNRMWNCEYCIIYEQIIIPQSEIQLLAFF